MVLAGRTQATPGRGSGGDRRRGHAFIADVSREADVLALRDAALARHGRIDVLVNNAGINPIFRGIERVSLEDWQSIIDINLTGTFLCCKHLGGAMVDRAPVHHQHQLGGGSCRADALGALLRIEGRGGNADASALALDWAKRACA